MTEHHHEDRPSGIPTPAHIRRFDGSRSGPTVVVLGGTHGDELVGVEVVKLLMSAIEGGAVRLTSGTLYAGLGNPAAIALRRRAAADGRDLNRSFVDSELAQEPRPDDRPDLIRARELAPILASADYLFDIHSTSSRSEPFACFDRDSERQREIYRLLPVEKILTDPDKILAQDQGLSYPGTTDEYVCERGGVAICYETGLETEVDRADAVLDDILNLLRATKTVEGEAVIRSRQQSVFALTRNVCAKESSFEYDPGMGRGWQQAKAGARLGRYGSGAEEIVPEDGIILFPKSPAKIAAGLNLYYLAARVR